MKLIRGAIVTMNPARWVIEDGAVLIDGAEIAAVDELELAGDQKKQIVADLAATLFDEFGDLVVPVVLRPAWWLIKPTLRSLIRTAAAGAVDALLPLVRKADE